MITLVCCLRVSLTPSTQNLMLAPYFFSSFIYIAVSGTFNGKHPSVSSQDILLTSPFPQEPTSRSAPVPLPV